MTHDVFTNVIILQSIFVLFILFIYLFKKYKKLPKLLEEGIQTGIDQYIADLPPPKDKTTSAINIEILDSEIQLTQAQIAKTDITENEVEFSILKQRLQNLEIEKQVLISAEDDKNKFWLEYIASHMQLLAGKQDGSDTDVQKIEQLTAEIETLKQHIENLEKFKSLFFELQSDLDQAQNSNKDLLQKVKELSDDDSIISELETQLETSENRRKELQSKLAIIESGLEQSQQIINNEHDDLVTENTAEPKNTVLFEADEEATDAVKRIVAKQKIEIKQLHTIIDNLEIEAKAKDELKTATNNLKKQIDELETVIEILEEENKFLQGQINELLRMDIEKDNRDNEKTIELKLALDNQIEATKVMETKFLEMEAEYLRRYVDSKSG